VSRWLALWKERAVDKMKKLFSEEMYRKIESRHRYWSLAPLFIFGLFHQAFIDRSDFNIYYMYLFDYLFIIYYAYLFLMMKKYDMFLFDIKWICVLFYLSKMVMIVILITVTFFVIWPQSGLERDIVVILLAVQFISVGFVSFVILNGQIGRGE
jgi:hypothetical protein